MALLFACACAQAQQDSLRARWRIQPTAPILVNDLDSSALDLRMPDNIRQTVEYDDSANVYYIGSKLGDSYLNAPILMTPKEYQKWTEQRAMRRFFRKKDTENVKNDGKSKFDFMDMHFDLGPAEKIFGPGGVRIKTQGTAELKVGANIKKIDNPSLPVRNRKGFFQILGGTVDFSGDLSALTVKAQVFDIDFGTGFRLDCVPGAMGTDPPVPDTENSGRNHGDCGRNSDF